MGILNENLVNGLIAPFSEDTNYRKFLLSLDAALPQLTTVSIDCECSNGTVVGIGKYARGTTFSLECHPNSGWYFHGWVRKDQPSILVSRERVYTAVASTDVTYKALISNVVSYEVTTASICGTVSGGGFYSIGSECILSCTPSSGFQFHNWSNPSFTTNPYKFKVNEDTFVRATCIPLGGTQEAYYITGSVSPSEAGHIEGGGEFARGSICSSLQAIPSGLSYFVFNGWSDGDVNNPHTPFLVSQDLNLIASFYDSRKYVEIIAHPDYAHENYSITGVDVKHEVVKGSIGSVSNCWKFAQTGAVGILPAEGYKVTQIHWDWLMDDGITVVSGSSIPEPSYVYSDYPVGYTSTITPPAAPPAKLRIWGAVTPITYKVNGSVNPSASGTVTATLNGDPYTWNTAIPATVSPRQMKVTFTPSSGYTFDYFKIGAATSPDNPCTFNVDADTNVVAICSNSATRKITFSTNYPDASSVYVLDENSTPIESGDTVYVGTTLTFYKSITKPHYSFVKWITPDGDVTTPTYSIQVADGTGAINVQLVLSLDTTTASTVHVKIMGDSAGDVSVSGYDSSAYYWEGDAITFKANMPGGYQIESWMRSDSEFGTYTSFSAATNPASTFYCPAYSTGEYWIKLTVAPETSVFNVSVPSASSISASVSGVSVTLPYTGHIGDIVNIQVGYDAAQYSSLTWSDSNTDNPRDYTLWSTTPYTLLGTLNAKPQYVVLASGTHCNVSGGGMYTEGTTVTLTATPHTGYSIKQSSWSGLPSSATLSSDFTTATFTVTSAITISVIAAAEAKYAVNIDTYGSEYCRSISASGFEFLPGEYCEVYGNPNDGCKFVKWVVNGVEYTNNPLSFQVTQDTQVDAYFALKGITVTTPMGTNGTCRIFYYGTETEIASGSEVVMASLIEFRVTPLPNCHFVKWTDDDTSNPRSITVMASIDPSTFPQFICEVD